jgi:CRISPR type IV-associated protein Csf3
VTWRLLDERRDDLVPLHVVAHMSEPVMYLGDGMHLDGILAAAAFAALPERTRRRMPPLTSDWPHDVKLPLARWAVPVSHDWTGNRRLIRDTGGNRGPELWGWMASDAVFESLQDGVAEVRKKPEFGAMQRYAREATVEIRSGALKAYDLAFPTVFAARFEWFARGDPGTVRELLTSVQAIGKKRNHGHGTVMRWEVECCAEDRSVVHDGRLMRRMPLESGLGSHRGFAAIRPPYHHPSRLAESVEAWD